MKKQIAWIFTGAAIVGLGMMASLSACSGDDTKTDAGGKDATSDTGNKDGGGTDVVTQDVVTQDVNTADCKTVPSSWPFPDDGSAGPYCPFQASADGGQLFADCLLGQHCCIPSGTSTPATCQATDCVFAVDASANADFQCEDTNDCTTGQICCLRAGGEVQQDLGCTAYDFVSKQKGTVCTTGTTCPTGQAQLCGDSTDCTGGKTCFPINTKSMWLGVCLSADGGI